MRTLNVDEFHAELKAQGVSSHADFAFVCPMCRTVQSARDLMKATGKGFDEVERYLGFSRVGRFTNAGPHKQGAAPGKGCDWTLGGLFRIHELEVVTSDGHPHPSFELATPDQARAHAATFVEEAQT